MQAFDWINQIAEWVGALIPKWELLPPTHGGVKFKPGEKVQVLKPGRIYWWWPATTEVSIIPIKRQTMTFTQHLTTKDDYTVLVSTVIVYTVEDVQKALVETYDFEDTIGEVAQKLVIKPIMSRDFEQICADMAESNDMRNEVTRNARSLLSDYGVKVEDGYVSDFVETKVFSHDGAAEFSGYDEE